MQRFEHRFVAMGGPCGLRLDSPGEADAVPAITAAEREVRRLERKYSRYQSDSLVSTINAQAGSGQAVPVDTETAGLLHYADTLWRESGGLFDLTAGVLRRAWDFSSTRLPEQAELDLLLPLIGWDRVTWDGHRVALPEPGMELDFGGCVKEYACDSAAAVLRQHGIAHALVDLAGDIAAVGPQAGGEPWRIGIRHPQTQTRALAGIELGGGGLASSGDYERCVERDGRRYGHILNPRTGWPVEGLVAVSVMAEQCLVAGSSATIAMLKSVPEALCWLDGLGVPWLAVDADFCCHGTIADEGQAPPGGGA